jgi:hypothetical protein
VKPHFAHLYVYGSRAYPLIPNIPKIDPRTHISYLVSYDSTIIYRVWVLSQGKVIRSCDIRIKDDAFYESLLSDIGRAQKKEVENLVELLEISEILVKIPQNENLLLEDSLIYDEIVVIPPQNLSTNSSLTGALSSNQQLLTPSLTPENILLYMDSPLPSGSNSSSLLPIQDKIVGRLPGYRQNQVSSNLNESLILLGVRG